MAFQVALELVVVEGDVSYVEQNEICCQMV
jgi:hypothetical protein